MKDSTSPATKADIEQLDRKIELFKDEFDRKIDSFKDDMMHQFKILAENLNKDFRDANKDGVSLVIDRHVDHEQRIRRLERHSGLAY